MLSTYLDKVDEGQASIEGIGLEEGGLFITNCCRLEVTQLQVGLCLAYIQGLKTHNGSCETTSIFDIRQ